MRELSTPRHIKCLCSYELNCTHDTFHRFILMVAIVMNKMFFFLVWVLWGVLNALLINGSLISTTFSCLVPWSKFQKGNLPFMFFFYFNYPFVSWVIMVMEVVLNCYQLCSSSTIPRVTSLCSCVQRIIWFTSLIMIRLQYL